MSRLLFVVLAGQGHVIPTLPLVSELARRGHAVEYACGPEFAPSVTAAGARWVPLPGMAPFSPPAQVGPEIVALWFRHFFAALAATYPVLLEHCREHRPDGVVHDATNWPARLVAGHMGLPAVRTVPNLAENPSYTGIGDALAGGLENDPTMAALAEDVAAFAAQHDVELDVAATVDIAEVLNLVFVPRAFEPAGDTFDERFLFLGPLLGDREQREAWSPSRPGSPVLLISLGSIFTDRPDFYRTCRDAFADSPYHVAMTIGELDPAELEPLPANIEVRSWFPQLAVLRQASAFLTHAGMNSTMEAISYGVMFRVDVERLGRLETGELLGQQQPGVALEVTGARGDRTAALTQRPTVDIRAPGPRMWSTNRERKSGSSFGAGATHDASPIQPFTSPSL